MVETVISEIEFQYVSDFLLFESELNHFVGESSAEQIQRPFDFYGTEEFGVKVDQVWAEIFQIRAVVRHLRD